jgi:exonuclease III
MLAGFLHKQDIDIALLQEVTQPGITAIQRYTARKKLGNERRGTAILTRDGITFSQIKRIPSGRGMAVEIKGVWYINVYAPSAAARKLERERFFNNELPLILSVTPAEILLEGDFISIINKLDSRGMYYVAKYWKG